MEEYKQLLELIEKYEHLVRNYLRKHTNIDGNFKFVTRILFGEMYVFVQWEDITSHTGCEKILIKDILDETVYK